MDNGLTGMGMGAVSASDYGFTALVSEGGSDVNAKWDLFRGFMTEPNGTEYGVNLAIHTTYLNGNTTQTFPVVPVFGNSSSPISNAPSYLVHVFAPVDWLHQYTSGRCAF